MKNLLRIKLNTRKLLGSHGLYSAICLNDNLIKLPDDVYIKMSNRWHERYDRRMSFYLIPHLIMNDSLYGKLNFSEL